MTIFKRFVYLFCCVGVHSMLPQSSSVQKKQTGRKYIHSVFVLFFFNVKFSNLRLRYVQVLRRLEWYNCFACFYYKLINILNKTFIYSYSFEDIDLIMSKDVVRNVTAAIEFTDVQKYLYHLIITVSCSYQLWFKIKCFYYKHK